MAQRILLTGARGFLGRHTLPILRGTYGAENVTAVTSADYDLMDPGAAAAMLADIRPEVVVHYAAYSGGIGANKAFPADFFHRNILLTANLFEAAARAGVKKLVYPMGGCSYPADAKSPIDESQLFRGYPQKESAGYSAAKMMGVVASSAYRSQYGLDSQVIIPGNMYGEYDNFDRQASHVVPAMIRRYHEAMLDGKPFVEMWGTGAPERDFVYAGDVARTIPYFIDTPGSDAPVNISSGTRTSIRELAETIAGLTGYQGEIRWDRDKPDGQMVKIFAVERLHHLGLSCDTPLKQGLEKTIAWFAANYSAASDGLRL